MTLSMPSTSAANPVTASVAHAQHAVSGAKAAGGFLEGFLAKLSDEAALQPDGVQQTTAIRSPLAPHAQSVAEGSVAPQPTVSPIAFSSGVMPLRVTLPQAAKAEPIEAEHLLSALVVSDLSGSESLVPKPVIAQSPVAEGILSEPDAPKAVVAEAKAPLSIGPAAIELAPIASETTALELVGPETVAPELIAPKTIAPELVIPKLVGPAPTDPASTDKVPTDPAFAPLVPAVPQMATPVPDTPVPDTPVPATPVPATPVPATPVLAPALPAAPEPVGTVPSLVPKGPPAVTDGATTLADTETSDLSSKQTAVLPQAATPAVPVGAPVAVPLAASTEPQATPKPKVGQKGTAPEQPTADRATPDRAGATVAIDPQGKAPDAITVPVIAPPGVPASAPLATSASTGTVGEKGVGAAQSARKTTTPQGPDSPGQKFAAMAQTVDTTAQKSATIQPATAQPVTVSPDAALAATPAPFATGEAMAQPANLQSAPAAPVLSMDRSDWPQTMVSTTLAGLSPDGGTMTMEISPDELGSLLITLTLEGDTASVQIETSTPEAARLLNEAERQLSQDFARQGVTLTSHDAQTSRRGDQGSRHPDHSYRTGDQDLPSVPVPHLRAQGIINLIA